MRYNVGFFERIVVAFGIGLAVLKMRSGWLVLLAIDLVGEGAGSGWEDSHHLLNNGTSTSRSLLRPGSHSKFQAGSLFDDTIQLYLVVASVLVHSNHLQMMYYVPRTVPSVPWYLY